jgi:hypothetical protein
MTFIGRRLSLALAAIVVLVGMAFTVKTWVLGSGGSPPNSPAAQALYWRTLRRLAAQPRFLLTETFRQQLPPEMTPMHTGGSIYALYRIRHAAPNWIQVTKTERAMIPIPSLQLVMDGDTFCVGDYSDGFPTSSTCSPRHPLPTPLYISDYLLGGPVDQLRFSSSPATLTTGQRRRRVILIRISGRGTLGCTPAYAGAVTRTGYHWCEPMSLEVRR